MKELKLLFKFSLLTCVATPFVALAQSPFEKWDTESEELIHQEIVMHRIVNDDLKNLIVEYDKMYAQYVADSTLGITVYCRIFNRKIIYSVNYTVNIGRKSPVLLCEPINGREIHIDFGDLYKQIQLPFPKSVELLKKSDPEQYEDYVREQKLVEEEGVTYVKATVSDFVTWEIVFDKYTGECLRKHTPNRTKRYQKQE